MLELFVVIAVLVLESGVQDHLCRSWLPDPSRPSLTIDRRRVELAYVENRGARIMWRSPTMRWFFHRAYGPAGVCCVESGLCEEQGIINCTS